MLHSRRGYAFASEARLLKAVTFQSAELCSNIVDEPYQGLPAGPALLGSGNYSTGKVQPQVEAVFATTVSTKSSSANLKR
jgi:hypothetical protein